MTGYRKGEKSTSEGDPRPDSSLKPSEEAAFQLFNFNLVLNCEALVFYLWYYKDSPQNLYKLWYRKRSSTIIVTCMKIALILGSTWKT